MKAAAILLLIACGLSSTFATNKLTDDELQEIGKEFKSAMVKLEQLKEHQSDPGSEDVAQVSQKIKTLVEKLQDAGYASLGQGES